MVYDALMITATILQARLDSSRLPNKALLPLAGVDGESEPLLFRVMEALRGVSCEKHILACPDDCASAFAPLAERAGFELYAGPKEDVLARYCGVARKFGVDRVIRATGDNPFVFADAADEVNREAAALHADYAGYAALPYGAGVESVSAEALFRAEAEAVLPSEIFTLHRPLAPLKWRTLSPRLTVDTRDDYERASVLYKRISTMEKERRFKGEEILRTAGNAHLCGA